MANADVKTAGAKIVLDMVLISAIGSVSWVDCCGLRVVVQLTTHDYENGRGYDSVIGDVREDRGRRLWFSDCLGLSGRWRRGNRFGGPWSRQECRRR
jgi:hypothetical protein